MVHSPNGTCTKYLVQKCSLPFYNDGMYPVHLLWSRCLYSIALCSSLLHSSSKRYFLLFGFCLINGKYIEVHGSHNISSIHSINLSIYEAGKLFYFYVVAKWYIRQMAHSPNGSFAKWYSRQMAHSPNGTHPLPITFICKYSRCIHCLHQKI
jgi:hypothetical protein